MSLARIMDQRLNITKYDDISKNCDNFHFKKFYHKIVIAALRF